MPGLKCILLTSILSLNFIVPIAAGPLEDGIAAFSGGDYATAIQLLRQFAERGNPSAQFYLGFMYANARGIPKNYAEALKWYRLAADQGHARAQYNLGRLYETGQGVPHDAIAAHMWFSLAAEHGDKDAAKARDVVARVMTSEQITKAQQLTRSWKPKQAAQ